MRQLIFAILLLILNIGIEVNSAASCLSNLSVTGPTIVGSIINEDNVPIVGIYVEISLPSMNTISLQTDDNGCYHVSFNSTRKVIPLSIDVKRKSDTAVLVRAVDRCQFDNNLCNLSAVRIISPNTVYLLPFGGEEKNQVFMSPQFRSALSKRIVSNLQELEGESVIRKLKYNKKNGKFEKLKPPGLKLYEDKNAKEIEVADFERLEKLGSDLNALALISGETSLDAESNTLDMSSFYTIPDESAWTLDDQLDAGKLKNMVMLSRKLSPQWTYYTMMALAKREFAEATASPNKVQELTRIKAYLQAQRNQLDSRGKIKQNELLDLLCEIRQALNEHCGEMLLSMD